MYIENEGNYDFRLDINNPYPVKFIVRKNIICDNGKYREVEFTNKIESVIDENGNKATLITTLNY